jgi:tetratricopeptide (TPR) repeat protein
MLPFKSVDIGLIALLLKLNSECWPRVQLCCVKAKRNSMKSTSGCVRILARSCTLFALLAFNLPSSVIGQTTSATYYSLGNDKQAKGDLDGAIADYSRAIELDPKNGNAYYSRGTAKRARNDLDGAIADFTHTLELDPKDAGAYTSRGVAKSEKGDLSAIADYNRAIEVNPKYALAYFNRGNGKQAKGDLEGAKADYDRATRLDPKLASAVPVFSGKIKVTDSDAPILQIFALTRTAPNPDSQNFSVDSKPLMTIRSIRNLIFQADGKGITVVLNKSDSKKFGELTRKFEGGLLFCQVSESPHVGGPRMISAPIEDGIIEFSEARFSGDIAIAEYLRRRFGK